MGPRTTPPAPEDAIREFLALPACRAVGNEYALAALASLVAAKEAAEEQAGDASALAVRLQDEAEDLREQRDALAEALRESNEAIDRFVATTSYFRQPKASRPEFEALLVARDTARAALAALSEPGGANSETGDEPRGESHAGTRQPDSLNGPGGTLNPASDPEPSGSLSAEDTTEEEQ